MITKDELKKVILDQRESFEKSENIIQRQVDLKSYINYDSIVVISGVRRCGKSTLLKIIKTKINPKDYLYCDFSDERLNNLTIADLQLIYEIFLEKYESGKKYFFFDEIQYVNGWEKFVNRLYEKEEAKIFVTGSNSSLLSSEISSVLTGRNKVIELYPFSFKEYITAKKETIDINNLSTKEGIKLNKYFDDYFNIGGFPHVINTNDVQILKEYYTNIIYKDIIVRKKIRQVKEIKEIISFLLNNIGQIISYKKIIANSEIKSTSTIKNFIDYLNEAYILFTLSKYDKSIRKQIQNPKKSYFIDMGMVRKISVNFSENNGWYLENVVFLELLRRNKEIYYHKKEKECDFVVKEGTQIKEAIQVSYEMNQKTETREIKGLINAIKTYNLKEGIIITRDQEETRIVEGYKIKIIPIAKWLLE
ncbi:MAG TPA: ATP-binding protein [archaeon]|jgi:uncharacterized protein|nr:ATP-binding protein [archaeon]